MENQVTNLDNELLTLERDMEQWLFPLVAFAVCGTATVIGLICYNRFQKKVMIEKLEELKLQNDILRTRGI